MHIYVVMDHLKNLIGYLKNYRENDFTLALDSTKENAIEMDINRFECYVGRIYLY